MSYHSVSDKYLKEFKELCDKKNIKYETEAEYEEADMSTANDLLVRFMARSLTGDPCTAGHAHVWAVTDRRVRVQMSDLILIGE
jgi:hypothetical protein